MMADKPHRLSWREIIIANLVSTVISAIALIVVAALFLTSWGTIPAIILLVLAVVYILVTLS